jgi:hypothetical protein
MLVTMVLLVTAAASQVWAAPSPWLVQSSPNSTKKLNQLLAAAATSSANAWAVGSAGDGTLIEHFDGLNWNVQASPSPGGSSYLDGVKALSSDNAWAVGTFFDPGPANYRVLIEHYDGSGWTRKIGLSYVGIDNVLSAVAATSASNVWSVGWHGCIGLTCTYDKTLIEHYDGLTWRIQASPNPGAEGDYLVGVAALSSSSAWAVGQQESSDRPLVEHYNGSSWVVQPSNGPSSGELVSASAESASDVWAVGSRFISASSHQTLIEHYDGTSWSVVPSPTPDGDAQLLAVRATSPTNAWAVGSYDSSLCCLARTLILHWDGTSWTRVTSPNVGPFPNILSGLAATSSTNAFAVGAYVPNASITKSDTLVMHCC